MRKECEYYKCKRKATVMENDFDDKGEGDYWCDRHKTRVVQLPSSKKPSGEVGDSSVQV